MGRCPAALLNQSGALLYRGVERTSRTCCISQWPSHRSGGMRGCGRPLAAGAATLGGGGAAAERRAPVVQECSAPVAHRAALRRLICNA